MARNRCCAPLLVAVSLAAIGGAADRPEADRRRSALRGNTPTDEILRLDVDGDKKPDVLERWWNGKRARWLDENADLLGSDTRGDQVGDVLQVDMDGDGLYDGPGDMNIKWADTDGDGVPNVQAFAVNAPAAPAAPGSGRGAHWMIFLDVDKDGVLGWVDWEKWDFDSWGRTGRNAWLPDYNGDSVFVKVHRAPQELEDPSLNWENPFSFYDPDKDGVSEMAIRWLDAPEGEESGRRLSGRLTEAYYSLDLDNDSSKDNETDYDISFRVSGGPGIDYRSFRHALPGFKGQPRFDAFFASNGWRRLDSIAFVPHDKGWDELFTGGWTSRYMTFDEDDDDHRWERVELYYPTHGRRADGPPVDIYSTKRWSRDTWVKEGAVAGDEAPGLGGHPQADSLGDRGEFDKDDSGKGQLYVGVFDRKLHLYGAEWGAWTVDRHGRYHGGWQAAAPMPSAAKVEEVVRYRDTDGNGFLDTVEFDYDGDRTVDLKVSLLDYKSDALPHPDAAPLLDARAAGWAGLRDAFTTAANQAWREALDVYKAAWVRGLTTPELDKLANAASVAQRYESAYWIKETLFRILRQRLAEARREQPKSDARWKELERDLTRSYYLGRFDEYVRHLGQVPAR